MVCVSVKIPVTLTEEEDGVVVAINPQLNIGSQGQSRVEALLNAKEALELYFMEEEEEEK